MKILNTCILKKSVITLSFLCYLITCGFVPYYYDEAKKYCEDSIKIRDNFKNFDFNKQEPQVAKVNVNRQRKLLHLTFDNF